MTTDIYDYQETMRDVRRVLEGEKDRLTERMERVENFIKMADMTDDLLSQMTDLKEENERLKEENERLSQEVREKEMKLSELSKLSVGVAKKSSQDEVLKALRTYANISKRKTLSKRVAVKMMIMELANSIGLSFPEDMLITLEALDDEVAEPKVEVQGDYVVSKRVEHEVNGVASGAIGLTVNK